MSADPRNAHAPADGARGVGAELGQGRQRNDTTVEHAQVLAGLLPVLALEVWIALDVARDLYLTGGCAVEDGRRLATAYQRIKHASDLLSGMHRSEVRE